jgi:Recombinase
MSGEHRQKGSDRNRVNADQFAAKLLPIIRELQASGVTEYRAIARELERRGIRTPRGGDWSGVQVCNILKRAEVSR